MSREEQIDRYREFAKPFLSSAQTERSVKLILDLDGLKDIAELMKIVTFGPERSLRKRRRVTLP
jgi:hypothetical protein